ncbi:MAG: AMP-binding protein [Gammaproteobacteria bacterium]|nr:AMP-binding protein [Gammaproteobacteria bacterium]
MFLEDSDKTALVWHEERISYRRVLQGVNQLALSCREQNYRHVVIFAENRPEWVYAFYAGWLLKATVIPVDHLSTVEDLLYILRDCQPQLIFYSQQTEEVVSSARSQLDYPPELLNLDSFSLSSAEGPCALLPNFSAGDTAVIIYTSGTTGSPKGVMLSFENLLVNIAAVSTEIPIFTRDDRVLALLPFHHIFPLLGSMVAPLAVGAEVVFSPSMSSEDIVATLQRHRLTLMIGVPRLYTLISRSIMAKIGASVVAKTLFRIAALADSLPLSRRIFAKVQHRFGGEMRYLISGGAKLEEETGRNLRTLGFEVLEGFGMTEAAPMITFTRPGEVVVGSAGRAMSGVEIRIVDGEITARGRNIMQGYYQRPEETAEVLRDGWLHTGDLGYLDAQGRLFITGRRKEIIVLSNGKNINPVEIEHKLLALSPMSVELAVYPENDLLQLALVPDFQRLRSEGVTAVEHYFREEVIDRYNRETAPAKRIYGLQLLREELPKTRLGKVKRYLLPEMREKQRAARASVESDDDEVLALIRTFLLEQKGREVQAGDHFELDIGLDSLDRVEFQTFLGHTFGLEVDEEILIHHPTVEKLAALVREKRERTTHTPVEWGGIVREEVELNLPTSWWLHNPLRLLMRGLLTTLFRIRSSGRESLPQQGPFILASNHQSFLDGPLIASFLGKKLSKTTYFFAKKKHLNRKWLRFLAERNNIIVVDIDHNLRQSIQKLASVLKSGKSIIIFPEGTRSRNGAVGDFRKTFAILAVELGVPIVPVAIEGAYAALPREERLPHFFQQITVTFLPPLYPRGEGYDEITTAVRSRIEAAVEK